MTIKIERDAMLCVINNNSNSETSSEPPCCKPLRPSVDIDPLSDPSSIQKSQALGYHHHDTTTTPELYETDDESSISSCSTAKGVTFAEPLVTQVRTRPRTKKAHLRSLFYTYEETQRFRQAYREERRLKAQEEAESEASSSLVPLGEPSTNSTWDGLSSQGIDNARSHRISRVVVLHKNTLETFIDKEMGFPLSFSDASQGKCKMASGDFFDNDCFWNGQITWY